MSFYGVNISKARSYNISCGRQDGWRADKEDEQNQQIRLGDPESESRLLELSDRRNSDIVG